MYVVAAIQPVWSEIDAFKMSLLQIFAILFENKRKKERLGIRQGKVHHKILIFICISILHDIK